MDLTFSDLYGTELDRELGTADRTQRFTTARRKAAVNAGQQEFVERTECLTRQATLPLSGAAEFDLESYAQDFGGVTKQGVSISILDANGHTTWIEGDDLDLVEVATLNHTLPGWRSYPAGRPAKVYLRRDGGAIVLGFSPAPSIGTGETWSALLPYWIIVDDLTADTDEPWSVNGNPVASLRPYRRACAHFAAAELEKLRKNWGQVAAQLQLFESYVQRCLQKLKPREGQHVRFARDYRRVGRFSSRQLRTDVRVRP